MKKPFLLLTVFVVLSFFVTIFHLYSRYDKSFRAILQSSFNQNNQLFAKFTTKTNLQSTSTRISTQSPHQIPFHILDQFHIPQYELSADTSVRAENLRSFSIGMTIAERHVLYNLISTFDHAMARNNISYFIHSGTLLGSYRHHDLIPWDDDVDVILSVKYERVLKKLFKRHYPNYILLSTGWRDRLWHRDKNVTKHAGQKEWLWPFIDIGYYHSNSTHILERDESMGEYLQLEKKKVFPLKRRPLYNLSLPVPHDVPNALFATFGAKYLCECATYQYSHMAEDWVSGAKRAPCSLLPWNYPLVKRKLPSSGKGVLEQLTLNNGTILYEFLNKDEEFVKSRC